MNANQSDYARPAPGSLSSLGIAAAAVLGFTLQPLIAIADPVALLITGLLAVVVAAGLIMSWIRPLTVYEDRFFGTVLVSMLIAMAFTAGDAWSEQRSIKVTCAGLQRIMLYEHRKRTDVPEIFRSLGCKIQG